MTTGPSGAAVSSPLDPAASDLARAGRPLVLDTRTKLFVFLAATWITCLVVGDVIGGKLTEIRLGGSAYPLTVGMIPFPVVFLLTDLLNEFYGARAARFVTFVGFTMALLTLAVLWLAVEAPWAGFTLAPDWRGTNRASYENVLASSWRILLASICAYLLAQLLDISIFHALKRRTGERLLWLRATGSTVVSQLVDTILIQFLAFSGVMPARQILAVVATSYAVKLAIAFGLTPLIYLGHALVERRLGLRPLALGPGGEPA